MHKNQFFVAILVLLVHTSLGDNSQNGSYDLSGDFFEKVVNVCIAETKAKPDDVVYLVTDKVPETKPQCCLVACFTLKTNLSFSNCSANIPVWMNMTSQTKTPPPNMKKDDMLHKIETILNFCNKNQKETKDICDGAKEYFTCYNKKAEEVGLPLDLGTS